MRPTLPLLLIVPFALIATPAVARVIYVDNRLGDDVNDGTAATISGLRSGPVRSLQRAFILARRGDVVEIANTGTPYYDSLRLIGGRCSGVPSQPFVVHGNGATLDGSEPVPADAWVSLGNDLWRLEPPQKGWFQLIRTSAITSEVVPEVSARDDAPEPLPSRGRWAAWRGAIYYRGLKDEIPANEPYRIAGREAGVFLYGVHDVVLRDLRLRHFRLDGVSAHDQVYDVLLQNLSVESNGRAGIFVGGSSAVTIRGGAARANREASLLLREKAKADVRDVALDSEPVVEE